MCDEKNTHGRMENYFVSKCRGGQGVKNSYFSSKPKVKQGAQGCGGTVFTSLWPFLYAHTKKDGVLFTTV